MKTYKSKIDLLLLVLVFAPVVFSSVVGIKENDYTVIFIMLAVTAFILHLFTSVRYIIKGDLLHIKCSILINEKIKIADIKSVTKTNNPLSAPALSLDRLEIKYGGKFNYTLVSPKDREDFVNSLLEVNPDIKVTL